MRTVLGILRQSVRHPLQCWIAHLGQLRDKLRLWLSEPGVSPIKAEKVRVKIRFDRCYIVAGS